MESASKQKHPRPSEDKRTIQPPVVLILRDRIVSYPSQQQRLNLYGPLKPAIKAAAGPPDSSESRSGHFFFRPCGLTRGPAGALTGCIDWLWSGRNRHQAHGGQTTRFGVGSRPRRCDNHLAANGRRPATVFKSLPSSAGRLLHTSNTRESL